MTKVFLHLVNMSIAAGYLILAVLALRLLLRKLPKTPLLWLWALVGIRLALPISLKSALSLIPKAQPIPPDIALSPAPAIDSGIPIVNDAINPVIAQNFTPEPAVSVNPLQVTLSMLALVWLVGVAVMGLYAFVSYRGVQKQVRVCVRLRGRIYLCDGLPTPFLLGFVKPRIYLPSDMEPTHQTHVLRHEYAHLRHHDNWWKMLGFVLLSVYWFHPLVWAAYLLFCRDLEMACDERAVSGMDEDARKAYSYALLACAAHRHTISVCPVAFGEGSIKSRIRNVLGFKKATIWVSGLILLIAGITAICFLTNPREKMDVPEETIPQSSEVPTQTGIDPTPVNPYLSPYPELEGLTFEDLDGEYTYVNGDLTLLFRNVTKVATQTVQAGSGESYIRTILLKTPDTTMEILSLPDAPWQLRESTNHEEVIRLTGQTGQIPLVSNEYYLHNLASPATLRLISRLEPSPGELMADEPSPFPPSEADLTFSSEEVAFQDLEGEYTYVNGNLSLLFRNVSKAGTRTLRNRNGEEYVQTILLKDFGTTMELSSPDMDGSQWAWRLSETSGTEKPITITDQLSRRVFSNSEYYLQDLLSGRTVLLLKRGAQLSESGEGFYPETAQSALVMDRGTGQLLYSYQPSQQLASPLLNRMVLALSILETHSPEEMVDTTNLPAYLYGEEYLPSNWGYRPEVERMEEMSVEDLLTTLLISSGHYDATYALARFGAGSEEAMVASMNAYVSGICPDTNFTDLYGLAQGQYTTAADTLTLVNRMLADPTLSRIWSTTVFSYRYPDGEESEIFTANYMLDYATIPDFADSRVTGGFVYSLPSTGIVCTAKDGSRELVCVLMGAERRTDPNGWSVLYYGNFEEMSALLNTILAE